MKEYELRVNDMLCVGNKSFLLIIGMIKFPDKSIQYFQLNSNGSVNTFRTNCNNDVQCQVFRNGKVVNNVVNVKYRWLG